jgi:nucleoside-diphosphate-sugar epimerase
MYCLPIQNLDARIANALDQSALQKAFTGCDVVIHSILGSPGLIRGSVAPAYRAAEKAGVRRLIYLSSMCVHGQAPEPGTTEESPLRRQQPFPYNTAKIDAEQRLLKLRAKGKVEVVIFRPGIVFGPRSGRIVDIANQLLQGTACFINEGKGICNTVYVDNLVHAMKLAMTAEDADGQAFFVGDREQVTWWNFYAAFATALGVDPAQIPTVPIPKLDTSDQKQTLIGNIRQSEWMQKLLSLASDDLKQAIKQVKPKKSPTVKVQSSFDQPESQEPVMSQEIALLQQSQYKLPLVKASRILGYEPTVPFEKACQHSINWLLHRQDPLPFKQT